MNILIIEDNEYKLKQIEASLNRVLKEPHIVWMNSRNAGLVSFRERNIQTKTNPYHIVITDNYLPLYSEENRHINVKPYASDIVNEIRRLGFEELPIIVCSSEKVEECDCNYSIQYDSSIQLDEIFKTIFMDLLVYMSNHSSNHTISITQENENHLEKMNDKKEIETLNKWIESQILDEILEEDFKINQCILKLKEEKVKLESLIENKKPKKTNHQFEKKIKKWMELDLTTRIYLYIAHVKIVEHPLVQILENKKRIEFEDSKENEVYVFKNYDEYKSYFLMYLDNVEESIINSAIFTKGNKGQIIAFKDLCEQIIMEKNNSKKQYSVTSKQIEGYITEEKVKKLVLNKK